MASAALLLGGCAVEIDNAKPAQAMAQQALPPGSVPLGWRVFQERCASCHGPAALGGSGIPNLLPLVRDMSSRQFIGLVLYRYDWVLASNPSRQDSASREVLVDAILQGREGQITMPAWQGEPVVKAHIMDLYAYLSARAQGTQGTGRPAP
jgi:mono/diheme cytochrome c family protein